MQTIRPAKLVLEDGTVFAGSAVGAPGVAAGEACFTTAMAGYEEAASDPSGFTPSSGSGREKRKPCG